MTEETSYFKIGFAAMLGLVALAATLVYLGGVRGKGDITYAETFCDKPVSGISVGSAVNFRGVKIGEVAKVGFVGEEYDVTGADAYRIYILMALNGKRVAMLGNQPMRATVTASGITGLSRIEIDMSPDATPPPKLSWTPRNTYIPSKPSLMDSFSDSATKVMNQINKMDLSIAWSNMNETVKTLAGATEGARSMLESGRAEVEKIVGDFSETLSAARELVTELNENPSLLLRERAKPALPETERRR